MYTSEWYVTLYKTLYYVKLLQEKYELLRGFFQLDRANMLNNWTEVSEIHLSEIWVT